MRKARIEIREFGVDYFWCLLNSCGKVIASSYEYCIQHHRGILYKTKSSAKRAALRAKRLMASAEIKEET